MPPTPLQPNPNSVIQNDEARGTNHLDFFRFVGRVVGKVRRICFLGAATLLDVIQFVRRWLADFFLRLA